MKNSSCCKVFFGFILLLIFVFPAAAGEITDSQKEITADISTILGQYEQERIDGSYFTIFDENGKVLDKTVRIVYVGDEFIAEDNRRYRVKKVVGGKAYAEMIGEEILSWAIPVENPAGTIAVQGGGTKNLIGVYSTHSDESYIPSDGTESIPGKGGIFQVDEALTAKLKDMGAKVALDLSPHEPHDASAYSRSRRTAVKLLQEGSAALVDVHRDGVPDPEFYKTEINGQPATKVRLVVGRQNQNLQANLDFAKRLKGYLDGKYPGLVRGIFMAKGNYNQDLTPRAILVEVGTYTNDKKMAENGAKYFATSLPPVLGINTAVNQEAGNAKKSTSTKGDWTALLGIFAVILGGGAIFLWISTGSWEGAKNKMKDFISKEWANYLGKEKSKKSNFEEDQVRQKEMEEFLKSQEQLEEKLKETNEQRADYQKD